MNKTELRLRDHSVLPDAAVVEIWWNGVFIGEVVGADGPGVRVLSKYPKTTTEVDPLITEVTIDTIHR